MHPQSKQGSLRSKALVFYWSLGRNQEKGSMMQWPK